LNNIHYVNFTI